MSEEIPSFIPKERRIAELVTWLPDWIETGLTANQAYNLIKGTPYGIRRQEFLALYREMRGEWARSDRAKYVRQDYYLSDAQRGMWPYPIQTKYRDIVEVTGLFTGNIVDSVRIYVDHDEKMTRREIEDEARRKIETQSPIRGMISIYEIKYIEGWINPQMTF